jgi:hypothetical protein
MVKMIANAAQQQQRQSKSAALTGVRPGDRGGT